LVAAIEPHSVVGDAPELRGSDFVERGAEDDALSDDESDGLAPTERLPCLVELCGVECAGLRGAFRHVCSVARRDGAVKYDDARGKTRGRRRAGRRGRDGRPGGTMPQGASPVNPLHPYGPYALTAISLKYLRTTYILSLTYIRNML
jgi:hypothetical protein